MVLKKPKLPSEELARELMSVSKTASPQLVWRADRQHFGTKMLSFGTRTDKHRDLVIEITARDHPRFDRRVID